MNIIVATPGRLLQHMDQTYQFDCGNLQVLVLDEADRILDMGFKDTLNSIIENLPGPEQRQTLLFSATQTKSVRDLARLSLQDPQYIAVHEEDSEATPTKLEQHYMVVEADQKYDFLYSFIRTHLKSKTIVFATTCKQVKFAYEMFRRLRPGTVVMHIHGKMSQQKRLALYYDFLKRPAAVLFATDLAARGLDFPAVDWVVQMDCPDTPESYIHRVGRTARNRSSGHGLMFLLPSETHMATLLKNKKVPMKKVKANQSHLRNVSAQFKGFLAEDPDLKYLAQKAFIAYIRSVYLQSNKEVFDVSELPIAEIADTMGLPGVPVLKFLKGKAAGAVSRNSEKNMPYALRELEQSEKSSKKNKKKKEQEQDKHMAKVSKLLKRTNQTVFAESRARLVEDDESEEDDFITMKRRDHELEDTMTQQDLEVPALRSSGKTCLILSSV